MDSKQDRERDRILSNFFLFAHKKIKQHKQHKQSNILQNSARQQIRPTANSYAKQGEEDNEPQIVLMTTLHSKELTTPIQIPPDLKLRSMNSTVRGLSGYDGGKFGIEIDEKEAALSLRNVSERPIQFVKDNLTEFGEKNAKIFKFDIEHIEQNSSDEGDYSVLNESDLYNFSIPMTNRRYTGNLANKENTPIGIRILHWKNNPQVDTILDRNASPNALNPNVSSVHLYDNLYSRIRSIQTFYKLAGKKTYDKIVIDNELTDIANYIKNGITKKECNDFLQNTKVGLDDLFNGSATMLSRVSGAYNNKRSTQHLVPFTLQDIINDFYRLGYRSIVIVDTGCRDIVSDAEESAEESARIQEQSKLNLKTSAFANDAFGTKRHKKGKKGKWDGTKKKNKNKKKKKM